MHVSMMHISMILDCDACVYDARMYVACVYDPRSLILMHLCMKRVSMIIDPHACVFDACMMRLKFCDGRTDGQGDSRSWISKLFLVGKFSAAPLSRWSEREFHILKALSNTFAAPPMERVYSP